MKQKENKTLIVFSAVFYIIMIPLMIAGTFLDLEVGKVVYTPDSSVSSFFESFGQIVYWAMWGPALTVLLLSCKDLYELTDIFMQYTKTIIKPNTNGKVFKFFNNAVKVITPVLLYVLCVIGWKKLIQNVTKNILLYMGKDNFSELVYFAVSAIVAIAAIFIFKKINKDSLNKLAKLSVAACLLGIFYKCTEELKPISERVRIREMIAYSNGFLNEKGMSEGRYSTLSRSMVSSTDFSAFTPWYKKGNNMGIYSRADSFPSGHTLMSCTLFLSYPLCRLFNKIKKAAPFMLAISGLYVGVMGFTRMLVGAHYLTDVVAAAIIGYTVFLFVHMLYNAFSKKFNF